MLWGCPLHYSADHKRHVSINAYMPRAYNLLASFPALNPLWLHMQLSDPRTGNGTNAQHNRLGYYNRVYTSRHVPGAPLIFCRG